MEQEAEAVLGKSHLSAATLENEHWMRRITCEIC